jgi:2-keto-3-deoxy-L-rhamnonate aldolase RhmA
MKSACRAHGKAAGGHQVKPDADALKQRIDDGFRFLAYGTDIGAMRDALAGFRTPQ